MNRSQPKTIPVSSALPMDARSALVTASNAPRGVRHKHIDAVITSIRKKYPQLFNKE